MALGTIGLHTSIRNNNIKSVLLLLGFPAILFGILFGIIAAFEDPTPLETTLLCSPALFIIIAIWFAISYWFHQSMINKATGAKPMERKEHPEVYNLLENKCIAQGITMPKLYIIETDVLNAYASGLNEQTYAITLTSGLIKKLKKDELEGVIAHELTHILNQDVRLLIVSIIFVGIISFVSELIVRSVLRGNSKRSSDKNNGPAIMIAFLVAGVGYLLAILIRFALSRKREYLANAGATQITKRPHSLASALEKISGHSDLDDVNDDVKLMLIDNAKSFMGLFATHPPIEKRIKALLKY